MNENSENTKGSPGDVPERNFTGDPFYDDMKLSGVGSLTTRPDTKQRSSHYLRTHAQARGAPYY